MGYECTEMKSTAANVCRKYKTHRRNKAGKDAHNQIQNRVEFVYSLPTRDYVIFVILDNV